MRSTFGARERGWLGGSAFAGLVAAHALTYFMVAPGHHDRAGLLHRTGHGDWSTVFLLAGAAFLAGFVALSHRWASPRDRDVPIRRLYRYAWTRLVPLQVIGFVTLECVERALKHGAALEALGERAVIVGIALQVVVALVCGLLLVAFTQLVRSLREAQTNPRVRPTSCCPPRHIVIVPRSAATRAWNLRGPPLLTGHS